MFSERSEPRWVNVFGWLIVRVLAVTDVSTTLVQLIFRALVRSDSQFVFIVLEQGGNLVKSVFWLCGGSRQSLSGMCRVYAYSCVNLLRQIVLVAVQDEGSLHLTDEAVVALKSLGATSPGLGYRSSYAFIGFKGACNPSWIKENKNSRGLGPTVMRVTIPYSGSPPPPLPSTQPPSLPPPGI